MLGRLAAWVAVLAAARPAAADVEDWEVNEIVVSAGGNPSAQYMELATPVGGCLFPSSRVEVFDAGGASLGAVGLAASTTCYGAPTYFLVASAGAAAHFGVEADVALNVPLPQSAGQVCFASSATRYDCVRWGPIETAIPDLFGPADQTSAPAPPDGIALARVMTTHVVADDWELAEPTPRAPNDGTPWSPPDAGSVPDASPPGDASPPQDAGPLPDARRSPGASPDARDDRFLDLEAVGGACSSAGGDGGLLVALALAPLFGRRRRAVP